MVTFHIDDIGASSKHFNQHASFSFANFWFLKRIWLFKRWAKYEELTSEEWIRFLEIFDKYKIIPIISITACWVEKDSSLVPFPEKFPEEAQILKDAFLNNKIVIANHGLTHCVVGKHLPKFWGSNREFHREFWSWLPQKIHQEHILKSQEILENFFGKRIEIFVPPGNVWSFKTHKALKKTNIKKVICSRYLLDSNEPMDYIEYIDDSKGFFNFHDRELKLYGEQWLLSKIKFYKFYH